MTTLLTASQIFVMDIETYEELMILRQQMLDAGATNAIVQEMHPMLSEITEEDLDQMLSEMTEEDFD